MSAAVCAAVAGAAISSAMSDDNGAEGANDAAADASRTQAAIAKDQWNRYKEIYEPIEREMVDEAKNYDTPEQYAKAAGEASATVSQQYSKAREQLSRNPGYDPSSASAQASMIGLNMAQAASDATAQNTARKNVSDTAYQRKATALGMGKGLDSMAANGLASSAQTSMSLANAGFQRAGQEAAGWGKLASNVVGSFGKNWGSSNAGDGSYYGQNMSTSDYQNMSSAVSGGSGNTSFDWE